MGLDGRDYRDGETVIFRADIDHKFIKQTTPGAVHVYFLNGKWLVLTGTTSTGC